MGLVTFAIDSEAGVGTGAATYVLDPATLAGVTWSGPSGTVTWNVAWFGGEGLNVLGPVPIAQQGRLLGFTITSNDGTVTLVSVQATCQDYSQNL